MSTPEPLDEAPAAAAETRGGDRFADIDVTPAPPSSCACCETGEALDGFGEDPE